MARERDLRRFEPVRREARDWRRRARIRREGLRLLCAGLLCLACWIGLRCLPGVRVRVWPVLENLLSCSCDFEEAVRCFSAQMEGEGDVGAALEDFCVTAFAAQTGTFSQSDDTVRNLALREAMRYPEVG